jgi:outer membrane receptor for ferrienterochelin and colicins
MQILPTEMKAIHQIKILVFLLCVTASVAAQNKDTIVGKTDDVVVTATRTERKLGNVAVPVTLVSQKTIQQAGSLRLKDILQEQTGLYLTSGFGTGVQVQGLSPDYTLILIDGEPMVGRTAGVLDLNRIAVGNIKKIEIVKGPSSSLYGSEALAGVINIITDKPTQNKFNAGVRYGTYNTSDVNVGGTLHLGKLAINGFAGSYNSDGFSIRPFTVERTVAPIWRFTSNLNLAYPISAKTKLTVAVRHAYEDIKNELAVTNNGNITYSRGKEVNKDWNINPVITHQFNANIKSTLRLYATRFEGLQTLANTDGTLYNDYLNHQFARAENQTDFTLRKNITLTTGAGIIEEGVKSTRYDNSSTRRNNTIAYGYTQAEWLPTEKISIIGGLRYDDNRLFASAFSPKLAVAYRPTNAVKLTASFGRGFKAPDFRQLYLNFTNTAAGGYSVYGTLEAQKILAELNRLGQISSFESDYYRLNDLKPEFSTGLNVGTQIKFNQQVEMKLNLFRNDIENLIDSRLVAYRNSGAQIFSYLNVRDAYTQGGELEFVIQPIKNITINSGYQLLLTADKEQLAEIENGKVFTKDANGFSRRMQRSEYIGLPNRSRHMANLKLTYEKPNTNWFATIRTLYRSQWAVNDADGNGLYNTNDDFAKGFVLLNISAGKTLNKGWRIQGGIDNLLDYDDILNLPNMPGRQAYISINYSFTKNKNNNKR